MNRLLILHAVLSLFSATIYANEQLQRGNTPWQWTLEAGAVQQYSSSLDTGGDMGANRFYLSGGGARMIAGRWRLGVRLGYGEDNYDFSGSSGFGGLDPWGKVREFRISTPIQHFLNQRWMVFVIPSLRFNAESGADLNDGANGGLLAGASYRISDSLSIGPGFGAYTEIEDNVSLFPILLIDWKITDKLSLKTGRGFAASRGPGLQLEWNASAHWQFALGGRYEKSRFRLNDNRPAPGGVGQDKAIPLYVLAKLTASKNTELNLIGGAETGANLRLDDASGDKITASDLSTATFFGATFQVRF